MFTDPLSLINPNVCLDDVLNAKTIGEAIQLLCPQLPGLPSKQRGKYKQRRFLSEDQRDEIMRARNRDNARRTRKRKKLYVAFLNNAIEALEIALTAEGEELDTVDETGSKRGRGRPRKSEGAPGHPDGGSISTEQRVEVIAQFLRALYSSEASGEPSNTPNWAELCHPDIVHRTPVPAHKDVVAHASASYADFHENKGFKALDYEVTNNAKFFDSVRPYPRVSDPS